jgi:hypothetical protein
MNCLYAGYHPEVERWRLWVAVSKLHQAKASVSFKEFKN